MLERPNLTVETHVEVVKILFDGERAVGVQGVRLSEPLEFRAEREVIVACGAYNSPQLLMLSGIGPVENMGTRLIEPRAADAGRDAVLRLDPVDLHERLDGQVRTLEHRAEERRRRRPAHAAPLCDLVHPGRRPGGPR